MRAPFARWRERASTRLIATAARTAGLVAALRGATARWRALTAEAEAMDGKWQAARRHKYKQRLRTSMRGLKLALARRHAKGEAILAAEAALAPARRRTGLHEWARRARAAREDALTLARCALRARATARRAALTTLREHAVACAARRYELEVADGVARRARRADGGGVGGVCARAFVAAAGEDAAAARAAALPAPPRALGSSSRGASSTARASTAERLTCRTAALHAHRQRGALSALQAHTIRRRVRLQALRSAALAAAAAARRRGLGLWRRRRSPAAPPSPPPPRRRAPRVASLPCVVGGWVRYHLRKRHKAAQLREAAEMHRRRLWQAGATQWLHVGLSRHALRLDAAAASAADRAAANVRCVEKYARHWRHRALSAAPRPRPPCRRRRRRR